jgi:hypothetical protein
VQQKLAVDEGDVTVQPKLPGVGFDHPLAKSGLQLGSRRHVDVVLRIQPDKRFGGVQSGLVLLLQQQEAQRSVTGVLFERRLERVWH